jgi:hypothetical protein
VARASLILFTAALVSRPKNTLEDKNLSCETLYCSSRIDDEHREVHRPKGRQPHENTKCTILSTILNPETHIGCKKFTSQTKRGQFLSPKPPQKCFSLFLDPLQNCEKQLLASPCLPIHCLYVCPSVRTSEWNNSAPIGWIFMKFYIWVFSINSFEKIQVR